MIHLVATNGREVVRPPRITSPPRVIDRDAIRAGWERWALDHRRKLWRESRTAFARFQHTGSRADQLATVRAFNLFLVGVQ